MHLFIAICYENGAPTQNRTAGKYRACGTSYLKVLTSFLRTSSSSPAIFKLTSSFIISVAVLIMYYTTFSEYSQWKWAIYFNCPFRCLGCPGARSDMTTQLPASHYSILSQLFPVRTYLCEICYLQRHS